MTTLQLIIYYASYLFFPAAVVLLWLAVRAGRRRHWGHAAISIAVLGALSVLAYARFVEPRFLTVKEHDLQFCAIATGAIRAVVWADPQLGAFGNTVAVERVVQRINSAKPDVVLIPGDFVYRLPTEEISDIFAPLAQIEVPVYAVLGNHDAGLGGWPDARAALKRELPKLGVTVLDGEVMQFPHDAGAIRLIGMRDHWTARDKRLPLTGPDPGAPGQTAAALTIALQHNPDVLREVRSLPAFDLMIAGHTHGGQIYLPGLTCKFTFACNVTRYGYRETPRGKVFVSSGTGLGGLPMRLNVPPVVDVLNISYAPCET